MTAYKYYDTGTGTWKYLLQGPKGETGAAGLGDVVGPASATDNAIARYDSTTGKLVQDSSGVLDDSGSLYVHNVTSNGSNGNLRVSSDTDGGEYNISADTTGTLAIFGSAGAILDLNLYDGDLKSGSSGTVRMTNAGALQNIASLNGDTIPTSNIVGLTDTQTLTNKRVTKREQTITSSSTPTPAGDTTDIFTVTALAAGATFAAPTGTPTQGQTLVIRIKDNATAQTLAWNAIYRAIGTVLPTTTVISKTMYLNFIYNSTDTKWDLVAYSQEV